MTWTRITGLLSVLSLMSVTVLVLCIITPQEPSNVLAINGMTFIRLTVRKTQGSRRKPS